MSDVFYELSEGRSLMSETAKWLFFIALQIVHPLIVVGVLGLVVAMSWYIVFAGHSGGPTQWQEVVRRAVGALLPYVILIFLTVSTQGPELLRMLKPALGYIGPWTQLVLGAALGVSAMVLAKAVLSLKNPVGEAVAALYFSVLGAMLLLILLQAGVEGVHLFLFGLVVASGLHIVFFGL